MMKYCPSCASVLKQSVIDGAQRYVCTNPQCDYVCWNNPVPVVAALVESAGRYILARNVQWPREIFSLITGYLESGETPEQAVLREVNEELGLQGRIVRQIGNYAFLAKNQVILSYEVQAWGTIQTNSELAEVKTLLPDELADYDFGPLYLTQQIIAGWKTCREGHN
jgi:NAD+ diphosphatase